ncbi:CD83 antigen-like [Huso huso]|uniref:CD83 antigen-like n=1 Tax=Huso huso TaxID=61971 RepID=A0ABR0YH22_HUSHU
MRALPFRFTSCVALAMLVAGDYNGTERLLCTARAEQGLQYRKVTWYKVEGGVGELTGLVLKDLHTNRSYLYSSANHSYQIEEDYSLLIPGAGLGDCGLYRCTLWAPLGQRMQEGDCTFLLDDCPEPAVGVLKEVKQSPLAAREQAHWGLTVGLAGGVCVLTLLVVLAIVTPFLKGHAQQKAFRQLQTDSTA